MGGRIRFRIRFNNLSDIFDGKQTSIEQFIIYRAYAHKYGSGAKSSIPAFEFLTSKFPNPVNARESLADICSEIGNKIKALESYKMVLKMSPDSSRAKEKIDILEGIVQK